MPLSNLGVGIRTGVCTNMTEPIDEAVWWMTDSEYAIWLENQLGE